MTKKVTDPFVSMPKSLFDDIGKFLQSLENGETITEYHMREVTMLLIGLDENVLGATH